MDADARSKLTQAQGDLREYISEFVINDQGQNYHSDTIIKLYYDPKKLPFSDPESLDHCDNSSRSSLIIMAPGERFVVDNTSELIRDLLIVRNLASFNGKMMNVLCQTETFRDET